MTIHYHGTPITPIAALQQLGGRHFCVPFPRPADVARVHEIGQSVMLDNGAFSVWRRGLVADWPGYYAWTDIWLDHPTTWAVIPDVIDGGAEQQDALIAQWPHGDRGAPVWHMHEPVDRLVRLTEAWSLVCMGSSGAYATVLSPSWRSRMDEAWNALERRHNRTPRVHMLRGMQCVRHGWPFYSVDSTDIGRNHNRAQNTPRAMADRWDAQQCPALWVPKPLQMDVFA